MGKSTNKKKQHKKNAIQSSGTKKLHEKIISYKKCGLDIQSMMCMTMTPDNSAVNSKSNPSLKELCQQLEGCLTSPESGLRICTDIKKYVTKFISGKLVPSMPDLLKVLPLLLSSPANQLRTTACDTIVLLFSKLGWLSVSKHCTKLIELLCYALASPATGVQQDALAMLKGLLLVPDQRSRGLASRLLPLFTPLLLKLYTKREDKLSTLDVYNEEVPKRISQFRVCPDVDNKDIEVKNADILDLARFEALSLIVGGCDDKLVSSAAPSLFSMLRPLLLNELNVASDLILVIIKQMEWTSLSSHLPLLVQQLGCALVCPHVLAQCEALRLLSHLLAAPDPLPRHLDATDPLPLAIPEPLPSYLSAHLLPFLTALLITRGLDRESSLAALTKAGAQAFPTCHNRSNESSSFPSHSFPSRALQFYEQLSAGDEAPMAAKPNAKRLTAHQWVEENVVALRQQQDLIAFIVNMCEDCLDRECNESVFSPVVEPLTDERNLLCLSAVLLAEQLAMLQICRPSEMSYKNWWRVVRTLDVLPRLQQRCRKQATGIQSAWLQDSVRPLLQTLGEVMETALQRCPLNRMEDTAVFFSREIKPVVESLKLQFNFYDEDPEDLVHYLRGVCESQTALLSSGALGLLPHLLADTVQLIVSTSSTKGIPWARSDVVRLHRGQSLAEPMVKLIAQEHPRASINVGEVARDVGSKVLADAEATCNRWKALLNGLMEAVLALYKEQNLPNRVKEALLEALLLMVHRDDIQMISLQGVQSWCSTVLEELCHLVPLPACVVRTAVLLATRHRALLDPYLPHARKAICENVMSNAADLETAEKQDLLKLLFVQ